MLANGGVDALDPERTEIALFDLAITVGVLTGLFDSLDRRAVICRTAAIIALGGLDNFFVAGVRGDASFYA
jgi:hypothetical protein